MTVVLASLLLIFISVTSEQLYSEKEGALVESINDVGFDLLQVFHEQEQLKDENLFYSPTSLSVAVAMVYLGARGKTAQEIAQVFKWGRHEFEDVHSMFRSLHEAIQETRNEDLELKMVNRIWSHYELEETGEFRDNSLAFYGTNIGKVDFKKNPEKAREEINYWVEQNTEKKIEKLIPSGSVNQETRLALINAIYFKGAWVHAFRKEKTFYAPFHLSGDRENVFEVQMMSRTSRHNYVSDKKNNCQMVELPFSGGNVSMFVILPGEVGGVTQLEQMLNAKVLSRWIALLKNTTVEVSIPKFLLSQQFELKTILQKLGMKDLFEAGVADLTGISPGECLHVSRVIHKAHVEVNEMGTEAAAATGVVVHKTSIDLHPVFYADHPFLFVIYHKISKTVLFLGRVMHPSAMVEQEEAGAIKSQHGDTSFRHEAAEL